VDFVHEWEGGGAGGFQKQSTKEAMHYMWG
jgi:hypothetical protein